MKKIFLTALWVTLSTAFSKAQAMQCRSAAIDPYFGLDAVETSVGFSTLVAARIGFFFEFSGNTCLYSRLHMQLEAGVTAAKASLNYEIGSGFGGWTIGPATLYNYGPFVAGIKGVYSGGELSFRFFQALIRLGAFAPMNSVNAEQSDSLFFQAQLGYLFE